VAWSTGDARTRRNCWRSWEWTSEITTGQLRGAGIQEIYDGTVEDLWGVRRRVVTYGRDHLAKDIQGSLLVSAGTYEERGRNQFLYPLALTRLVDYSKVKQDCAKWHPKYFVLNKGDRLDRTAQLKPMMYMRGIQQTFIDLAVNPKIVECIRDHIVNYFVNYNRKSSRRAPVKWTCS